MYKSAFVVNHTANERKQDNRIEKESSELNTFFNQTNNQMARMSRSQTFYGTNNSIQDESDDPPVTLGDICSVVSHVANKITEKKNNLDLLRGFRLPSTKLNP